MKTFFQNNRYLALVFFISFLLHSLLAIVPPLNGDEAHFWDWSRHLALGYYAHPPMTAWAVALNTFIFGESKYALRLTSIFLHLGTSYFVYLIAFEVSKKKLFAFTSVILYMILPISVIFGTGITTDSSLIFFWAFTTYFAKKAIVDGRLSHWYLVAVGAGGMMLSKFMALYFYPVLFFFLLFNATYRKQLLRKEPYLAFLLSLLLLSPFIYWNMQNHWLTIQFNFFYRHVDSGFRWFNPLLYLAGQMLAASPVFFILLLMAMFSLVIRLTGKKEGALDEEKGTLLLLSYSVAVPLLIYFMMSFTVVVGGHWAAVVFPAASVLVTYWIFTKEKSQPGQSLLRNKLFTSILVTAALIVVPASALLLFPKMLPDKYVYLDPENPVQTPVSHYFGWREVGEHLVQLQKEWGDKPEGFFFTTRDYSLGSLLNFYTPGHADVLLAHFPKDGIHGRDFLLWEGSRRKMGANTIYIADAPGSYVDRVTPYFESVEDLSPLIVKDEEGRILRVFYFTLGRNYLGNAELFLSLW